MRKEKKKSEGRETRQKMRRMGGEKRLSRYEQSGLGDDYSRAIEGRQAFPSSKRRRED